MDRNECTLVGRIGSPIKFGKTKNGNPYMWFMVDTEPKANATSTEYNYHQQINTMCFKKKVIDYFKKVNAHQGCLVVVFGFVSSFVFEWRGKTLTTNGLNANEVYIIKTKLYEGENAKS